MTQHTAYQSSSTGGKHLTSTGELPHTRAKRRKGLNAMTDVQVWDYSDDEILTAIQTTWRSHAYEHYELHLERHLDALGNPHHLTIRFECKYHSIDHYPKFRERMRSGDGTQNLLTSANKCNHNRGHRVTQPTQSSELSEYTEAKHRAILAIRYALERESFESVVDDLHRQEVELLRPGTQLPLSTTVSNDVEVIYSDASHAVACYLQQIPGALHLAVDGCTSPTSESYPGLIVFWHEKSKIWRAILEFVRLTEADKGDYMANRVVDCMRRYGIENKVMSICLDNAPNNDTLVTNLQKIVPDFRGAKSRVRCFPHIISLMAKSFVSLFSPPPRRQKSSDTTSALVDDTVDPDDSTQELDPDKLEHDESVINEMVIEAQNLMATKGVSVSQEQLEIARTIMFKVSGLARRVNDSPALETLFRDLVFKDPELRGDQQALARRIATQWNTDRTALDSHLHFKGPVQWLTGSAEHNLERYALDDEQWALAAELSSVLEVFHEPTDRFLKAEVPLVHDTIPELLTLKARLQDVRDDVLGLNLRPIIQVAAQAALLVYDKYMGVMEESDIYDIAVVMCPDRKLKWFSDRGLPVDRVRERVLARFKETYKNRQSEIIPETQRGATPNSKPGGIWTQRHSSAPTGAVTRQQNDSMEEYLGSTTVSPDVIAQYGGILGYWTSELKHRPRVARMALDYLTAPASSVDAECALSGGRLITNHLQHQMSSRTFQAQMVIGSWFQTPLLPSLSSVSDIISSHM